jgi:hypothetical protein
LSAPDRALFTESIAATFVIRNGTSPLHAQQNQAYETQSNRHRLVVVCGHGGLMCPVIPALSANPDSNVTQTDAEVLGYGEK